jgi:hypothetical protein
LQNNASKSGGEKGCENMKISNMGFASYNFKPRTSEVVGKLSIFTQL